MRPPKVDTLRQYSEDVYLTQQTRIWKASTAYTTEHLIQAYILRDLSNQRLDHITRRDLQMHLDGLANKQLSASVVKHVKIQLRKIFAMAIGDGLVAIDPTRGLVTPRCTKTVTKLILEMSDFHKALMVLDVRERLIFQLALFEGMRPGEIVGIRICDISNGEVQVVRRIYAGNIDVPKTPRSRRPVPLTRQTQALLNQYISLLPETGGDAWLFPSETGRTPMDYKNVWRRRIQPALATVELGYLTFQILRRTWVTEFDSEGRIPHTMAAIAGHSVDVSQNVYRQAKPEERRRAVDEWSDRLQ